MSVTTTPQTASCAYRECEAERDTQASIEGSYCSRRCYHLQLGTDLLLSIERRHELCSTCFRPKKTIERPDPDFFARHFRKSGVGWALDEDGEWTVERYGQEVSRDAVVGFAYGTEHAEMGPHGLECVCGAIESDTDEPAIRELEDWPEWLEATTRYLVEIGARETVVDADLVRHAYERTGNLPYSIGVVLDP